MSGNDSDAGFLSRWSRRKAQAQQAVMPDVPAAAGDPSVALPTAVAVPALMPAQSQPPAGSAQPPSMDAAAQGSERPPPPTLADVAALTRDSDYSRFVAPDVSGEVKNAALKKLFGNPHFNVMDGLDVYIDDYSKPDPLPAEWLAQMNQMKHLGHYIEKVLDAAGEKPREAPGELQNSMAEQVVAPTPEAAPADTVDDAKPPSQ